MRATPCYSVFRFDTDPLSGFNSKSIAIPSRPKFVIQTPQTKEVCNSTSNEDKVFVAEFWTTTMRQLSKERMRLWKASALGVRNGRV